MSEKVSRSNPVLDKLIEKKSISVRDIQQFESELPVLSTGVFPIDMALGAVDPVTGNGGVRARDLIEICAKNGSGKTAIANSMIATTQRRWPDAQNVVCFFSETADFNRMEREGVNVDNLIIVGQHYVQAEDGLDAMLQFCEHEEIKLCIIDSIAALAVTANKDKDLSKSEAVAALAKVFNRFSAEYFKRTKMAPLIMLNHYRDPVNTTFTLGKTSSNPLTPETVGGRTKEFLSKARIMLKASPDYDEDIKHSYTKDRKIERLKITADIFRNKYAPPMRKVRFKFDCNTLSFNNGETTLRMANYFSQKNPTTGKWESLIDPPVFQAGSWVNVGEQKWQGFDNACQALEDDVELITRIQNQIVPRGRQFFDDEKKFDDGLE